MTHYAGTKPGMRSGGLKRVFRSMPMCTDGFVSGRAPVTGVRIQTKKEPQSLPRRTCRESAPASNGSMHVHRQQSIRASRRDIRGEGRCKGAYITVTRLLMEGSV